LAAAVEVERRSQNIEHGRSTRYGAPIDSWTPGIEGAIAEMALAKLLNVFWSGAVGDLRARDAGRLQVRSTSRPDGCLILHDEDADDDIFVLAIGVAPTFKFCGWITGRSGKDKRYWRDPAGGRPAYFVPQSALQPVPRKYAARI
jgi:hypothetical protein